MIFLGRVPRGVERQVTQWVRFQSDLEQQESKVIPMILIVHKFILPSLACPLII
jgi:hypothetical protein